MMAVKTAVTTVVMGIEVEDTAVGSEDTAVDTAEMGFHVGSRIINQPHPTPIFT